MSVFIQRSSYDDINDVLYLHFVPNLGEACYGDDEEYENVILKRRMDNDDVVGVTVLYPKAEASQREMELERLGYNINLGKYITK